MFALTLTVLAATNPCIDSTDPLRSFSTCFDPWRGFEVAGASRFSSFGIEGAVSVDLRMRRERESSSKADSTWLSLHRFAGAQWQPRVARVDATAWEFVFRRHAADTSLTLPTIPVTRLPFPFDIGLAGSVVRFEWAMRPTESWALETARFGFLFDPIRAETNQFHLGFGPVAQHRVASFEGALQHDVMPLTGGLLFFSAETNEGHAFVRSTTVGGAVLKLDGANVNWSSQVRSQLEAGLVLLALNDQPLVLSAKGEAWWRAGAPFEWSASATLGFRLFSDRRS